MVVSEVTRKEIEERIVLYEAAKERIKTRIESNIRVAIGRLETIESELLEEVDEEFGKNPFAEFLSYDNSCTDADAKRLLAEQKIPENFGPDEKPFYTLFRDIDSLRSWRIFAPKNLKVKNITWDSITLTWDKLADAISYQIEVDGSKKWKTSTTNTFIKGGLLPETEHSFRIRAVGGSSVSKWSGVSRGRTLKAPKFSECVWKECPDVDDGKKYAVDRRNPRVATKVNSVVDGILIVGFQHYILDLPINTGTRNMDQKKECGRYVHTGDSVGVMMDTTKGDLSFVLNGVNFGVAYKGIPLDKPLVPCVILKHKGDSVELDISEVKETNVDSSIPVPPNITTKSGTTWDTITLTWDKVCDASFYQIEVDESNSGDAPSTNVFYKRGFLSETEHSFRVRTVRGSSVSEWSSAVKGKTLKESFKTSGWKECPDDVEEKYSVDGKNPRIATKVNALFNCTITGNTPIPLNTVTSWIIKIFESKRNNGYSIYIGIVPFDINQNADNSNKCGWYFYCYWSKLRYGHPHNYSYKAYEPEKNVRYVHTGDSVGVMVDTAEGDLSFVLNGVDPGVAYYGIPLDKPLVPCVILGHGGDSVELIT